MKVLFDTNVLLDFLLAREPHAALAARLLALVHQGRISGCMTATAVTTVYYVAVKAAGVRKTRRGLRNLTALLEVAAVDRGVIERALAADFPDFEDAVVHEAARSAGASAIVTRNIKDFAKAQIPVFAPADLVAALKAATD